MFVTSSPGSQGCYLFFFFFWKQLPRFSATYLFTYDCNNQNICSFGIYWLKLYRFHKNYLWLDFTEFLQKRNTVQKQFFSVKAFCSCTFHLLTTFFRQNELKDKAKITFFPSKYLSSTFFAKFSWNRRYTKELNWQKFFSVWDISTLWQLWKNYIWKYFVKSSSIK